MKNNLFIFKIILLFIISIKVNGLKYKQDDNNDDLKEKCPIMMKENNNKVIFDETTYNLVFLYSFIVFDISLNPFYSQIC